MGCFVFGFYIFDSFDVLLGGSMLNWFDASEAQKFAETLARLLMENLPLDAPASKEKRIAKQQEAILSKLSQEILRFKQQNKLNVYKKAKLGNTFKWTLKDAGYDSTYIDQLTTWLMLQI
jgi:hypothetical protein